MCAELVYMCWLSSYHISSTYVIYLTVMLTYKMSQKEYWYFESECIWFKRVVLKKWFRKSGLEKLGVVLTKDINGRRASWEMRQRLISMAVDTGYNRPLGIKTSTKTRKWWWIETFQLAVIEAMLYKGLGTGLIDILLRKMNVENVWFATNELNVQVWLVICCLEMFF